MKERLKNLLEKMPALYHFVETSYYRFRRLKEYLLGTKAIEKEWATRHLRKGERERDDWDKGSDDWIKGYWDSQDHPHRPFLIERISKFSPNSILRDRL